MTSYTLVQPPGPAQPVLLVDTSGNPYAATGGGGGSVTQGTVPWVDNITQFGGTNIATGTGAGGAGIPRVTVSNDSTLGIVAGSAIIGKVGIDQTTPGTTNAVVATGAAASGSALSGNPVLVAGSDGTDARDLSTDTSGRLITSPTGAYVTVTPTIQNAAYVSGNNMGGLQTIALGSSQSVLNQVTLASQGGLATGKVIYIFGANPTASTFTDRGTFTIATADLSKLISVFTLTPSAPIGTTKTFAANLNMSLGIPSGGTIYLAIVETASETPATITDLVLTLSAF